MSTKKRRMFYSEWLYLRTRERMDYTIYEELNDSALRVRGMACNLLESFPLTYNKFLIEHARIIGGLEYEIWRLKKIRKNLIKKGNPNTVKEFDKYK